MVRHGATVKRRTPIRIGTAGWSIPRANAGSFPERGTALERYASRFAAVEINSSFHRPHRPATYARWAASVPDGFRFAIKLPKTITHANRLIDCEPLLSRFADEIGGLGASRGPLLVQLPPSLAFDADVAGPFFETLAGVVGGQAVCEPRHASWFTPEADGLLRERQVARVAADPATHEGALAPGGWPGVSYYRFHGSPRTYWSAYAPDAIERFAGQAIVDRDAGGDCWVIFDNTAAGAALPNALDLVRAIDVAE